MEPHGRDDGSGQRRLMSPSTELDMSRAMDDQKHEHDVPTGDPPPQNLQAPPRVVAVRINAAAAGSAASASEPAGLTVQPPASAVVPAPLSRAPGSLLAKAETVAEKRARLEQERAEEARFNELALLQKSLSAAQTQEEAVRSELHIAAQEQARLQTELDEANHVIESAAARTLQKAFAMRWTAMLKGDAEALKEERRAFTLIAMQQESQALRVTLSEKRVELVSACRRHNGTQHAAHTHARARAHTQAHTAGSPPQVRLEKALRAEAQAERRAARATSDACAAELRLIEKEQHEALASFSASLATKRRASLKHTLQLRGYEAKEKRLVESLAQRDAR